MGEPDEGTNEKKNQARNTARLRDGEDDHLSPPDCVQRFLDILLKTSQLPHV